jgi:hypothetical protein
MVKRLVLVATAAAAIVVGGTTIASAQGEDVNRVTLLLRSGQRVTGELASFDHTTVDLADSSGRRTSYPMSDVVIMDFNGDAQNVPSSELNAANAIQQPEQVLVFRGGRSVRGHVVDFTQEGGPGATLIFDVSDGGRQTIPLHRVGRLYVSPMTQQAMATATSGQSTQQTSSPYSPYGTYSTQPMDTPAGARTITVMADNAWVDTGIAVRRGDRLDLNTTGTIYLRANGQSEASPAGAVDGSRAARAPMPGLPTGALIGRIGNGRPFGIGNQSTIVAPAAGELFLGINDDYLGDNSGQFTVTLSGTPVSSPYARPRE